MMYNNYYILLFSVVLGTWILVWNGLERLDAGGLMLLLGCWSPCTETHITMYRRISSYSCTVSYCMYIHEIQNALHSSVKILLSSTKLADLAQWAATRALDAFWPWFLRLRPRQSDSCGPFDGQFEHMVSKKHRKLVTNVKSSLGFFDFYIWMKTFQAVSPVVFTLAHLSCVHDRRSDSGCCVWKLSWGDGIDVPVAEISFFKLETVILAVWNGILKMVYIIYYKMTYNRIIT